MTKNRALRLPDDLDRALRLEAADKGIPVHTLILDLLKTMLGRHWVRSQGALEPSGDPSLDTTGDSVLPMREA